MNVTDAERITEDIARALAAASSTDEAVRALLALVVAADRAALDHVVAAAAARAAQDDDEGTVARMIEGAALARRAVLAGHVARGPVDDVVAALNALAHAPRSSDRAAAYAPLGAFVLSADGVPPFVDMRVDAGTDDVVLTWTSGAAALRHVLAGTN